MKPNMTIDEKVICLRYIGEVYKRCKQRIEIAEFTGRMKDNQAMYDSDRELVRTIDLALAACRQDTRNIISHEFLVTSEPGWHAAFFSRSTYYRLRKIAIDEFIRCLDI